MSNSDFPFDRDLVDSLRYMHEALISRGGIPYVDWSKQGDYTAFSTGTTYNVRQSVPAAKQVIALCPKCQAANHNLAPRCEECGGVIPQ